MNYVDLIKDNTYSGVILVLDKDLSIMECNQVFCKLTGYTEEELQKSNFADLVLPNDKSRILDVLYSNDVSKDITIKVFHKSGSFRFFNLLIQSFTNSFLVIGNTLKKEYIGNDYNNKVSADGIINVIKDNVEDIKDLLSFKDSSLNFILDLLPLDLWIKDKYGKYIYCNKAFTKHTGFTLKDMFQKNDYEIFDKDVAREFELSDTTAIESKNVLNFQFESKSEQLLTWTEVTKIPLFNKEGTYIGIIGFSLDITNMMNVQNVYEQESNQIKKIFNNLEGVVYEINPKGTLLFRAGQLVKHFNKKIDDDFGVLDFINSKGNPYLNDQIRLAYGGNKRRITTNVGKYIVEFTLIPVPNKYGTNNLVGYGHIVGEKDEE